jgi:hypothetical protein
VGWCTLPAVSEQLSQLVQYLGIFLIKVESKTRKANIFAASRFSTLNSVPHRTDMRDILCCEIFTKICRTEVGLKSEKNNRDFT